MAPAAIRRVRERLKKNRHGSFLRQGSHPAISVEAACSRGLEDDFGRRGAGTVPRRSGHRHWAASPKYKKIHKASNTKKVPVKTLPGRLDLTGRICDVGRHTSAV